MRMSNCIFVRAAIEAIQSAPYISRNDIELNYAMSAIKKPSNDGGLCLYLNKIRQILFLVVYSFYCMEFIDS